MKNNNPDRKTFLTSPQRVPKEHRNLKSKFYLKFVEKSVQRMTVQRTNFRL